MCLAHKASANQGDTQFAHEITSTCHRLACRAGYIIGARLTSPPSTSRARGVLVVSPQLFDRPSIKLGVFSMPAHPPHRPYTDVLAEDLEMLVLADQLGFSEAWL